MSLRETTRQTMALTAFECKKLWAQKRFYYTMGVMGVMTILCLIAIYMRFTKERSAKTSEWMVDILEKYVNGVNFSISVLGASLFIIMPMIVGIFTVTCFAGEYQQGQVRTIALRPVSRWEIFLSKFLAMSVFSLFLLFSTLIISYVVGAAFFKVSGDIFVWDPGLVARKESKFILPEAKAWSRFFLIYALSLFSLTYLVALFLMCSAIFKKTATAIMLPLGLYFACHIIQTMPIMEVLKDFLPTRYIFIGKYVMATDIMWANIAHDGLFTLAFTAVFLAVGGFVFNSADL